MLFSFNAKQKIRDLLSDPNTPGTVLLTLAMDNYSDEALEWDPEVLSSEFQEDYNAEIPRVNLDKLHALVTSIKTDRFYNDWLFFNAVANALNDEEVDFENPAQVNPEEAAWAITEVLLHEDPNDRPEFSPEVRRYLGVLLNEAGVIKPPDVLQVADIPATEQDALNSLGGDKAMVNGWYELQQANKDAITSYLRENLASLVEYLDELPLESKDDEAWQQFKTKATKQLNKNLA